MEPIYLDYNATTPMDPRVLDAMLPWFLAPSNSGSRTHVYGQRAKNAVDLARSQVAAVLGGGPEDIVFTSGATESNNLAILGLAEYGKRTGRTHIISTAIEHKAVLEPLRRLAANGFTVELAPVTPGGFVEQEEIKRRLRPETLLVSVMHANNETGVLQPVEEIGRLLKDTPVLFHVDAAQTFGKEPSLQKVHFDFASVSGHKIYGPQGIGALCIRRHKFDRRELAPIFIGGGQERGMRHGTVPVSLAVGIGMAASLANTEEKKRRDHATCLKNDFLATLGAISFQINGDADRIQPHVLNLSFQGVDSEALMMALKDKASFSNGSACTSSQYSPSHVLTAMGFDEGRISSAVRLSWGAGLPDSPFSSLIDAIRQFKK